VVQRNLKKGSSTMPTDSPFPTNAQRNVLPNALAPGPTTKPSEAPVLSMGKIYATRGALDFMQRHGVEAGALLSRHVFADPGELGADDIAANAHALRHGLRVLSVYAYGGERERVWLITEADRSRTTILLPDEY
jgi:hypothetical protein